MFPDRPTAGRQLAPLLASIERPIILALPRGGIPVGDAVARTLSAPLDVFVVRKLGAPFQPELAIGAIAEGGVVLLADEARLVGASEEEIAAIRAREEAELARRVARYRGGRPLPDLAGRNLVIVDDGIATGSTMRTAVRALRTFLPRSVTVASPVASREAVALLRAEADDVVCVEIPEELWAIGAWYEDFAQVSDEEVVAILDAYRAGEPELGGEIAFDAAGVRLRGELSVPPGASAIVLFAHGSGSSRKSPRNQRVAAALRHTGLGTLLFDLLTAEEEERDLVTGELRFDIELLAQRLAGATHWLRGQPSFGHLAVGYFGASTGAAAALIAAAALPDVVGAVVSRGGRPDLAGAALPRVRAPTLLIVGGADYGVVGLNHEALARLRCERRLEVVPGATHLFEEPGALDRVAELAAAWFIDHLVAHPAAHP
jgi:putative phosphoribosyl transferase